ncbi:MAG: sugar phosphate nucleotidyltransferase, partial [Planctomycetota bacterium]
LGIEPSRPATGYGYIQTGAELDPGTGHRVLSVERFVEKPDHETALGFLADGGYLWNSGIFAWQIGTLLEEMQSLAPELHAGTIAMSESFQQGRNDRAAEVFRRLPRTSLDYALLEKSRVVEVLPAEFQWDDVGSFDALLPYLPPDENDNRRLLADGCRTMIRDGSGNLVLGRGGHLLAVLGLSDLVLVHTPDATLVCPRHRVEEVKKLVQEDLGEDSEFR